MLSVGKLKQRSASCGKGFTLVELLVVVVVLAVLAAVVLPKFIGSGQRSKDSALKGDLRLIRNAVQLYKTDTGLYPKTLADLSATAATGLKGMDGSGSEVAVTASDWHGPYVETIPNDPVSGEAFTYTNTSGAVKSSATGNDSGGTAYSSY